MFTVTRYPHGTFGWADLATTDTAKAKEFYTGLMGWEFTDLPLGGGQFYTMFRQDGRDIVGMGGMMPGQESTPPHWSHYINVENVDALVDRIKALGGSIIVEPMDIFDSGRMLVIQDSVGAFISFWQAKNHIGSGLVNTPGAVTWNELNMRDPQKARDFYGPLLGWTFEAGQQPGYTYIYNQGRLNGGILQMSEEWGDMPPVWMLYFSVKNIDEAAAKVTELGGRLHTAIMDAPGTGRFAVIADPQGAVSTLIQLEQPQPWNE